MLLTANEETTATRMECEKCPKTFTRKSDLKRHTKQVHQEQKLHQCGICSKTFARKQHKEWHLRVCSMKGGDAIQEKVCSEEKVYKTIPHLSFTPVKGQTAFGGVFTDWSITYPDEYQSVDPVTLLNKSVHAMKDIIIAHNKKYTKRLKFVMSIHVVFQQGCDPTVKTEPSVVLHSSPFEVFLATDIEEVLDKAAEQLFEMIENYEGVGSGWVLDYLEKLDTSITSAYTGVDCK